MLRLMLSVSRVWRPTGCETLAIALGRSRRRAIGADFLDRRLSPHGGMNAQPLVLCALELVEGRLARPTSSACIEAGNAQPLVLRALELVEGRLVRPAIKTSSAWLTTPFPSE